MTIQRNVRITTIDYRLHWEASPGPTQIDTSVIFRGSPHNEAFYDALTEFLLEWAGRTAEGEAALHTTPELNISLNGSDLVTRHPESVEPEEPEEEDE